MSEREVRQMSEETRTTADDNGYDEYADLDTEDAGPFEEGGAR